MMMTLGSHLGSVIGENSKLDTLHAPIVRKCSDGNWAVGRNAVCPGDEELGEEWYLGKLGSVPVWVVAAGVGVMALVAAVTLGGGSK